MKMKWINKELNHMKRRERGLKIKSFGEIQSGKTELPRKELKNLDCVGTKIRTLNHCVRNTARMLG